MNAPIVKFSAILLVVLSSASWARPQAKSKFALDKMDNVLYGVAYYSDNLGSVPHPVGDRSSHSI